MSGWAVKMHKRAMIDEIKIMVSQNKSIQYISTRLLMQGIEYSRARAYDVAALYIRTADIVSGMSQFGLKKALENNCFL